MRATTSPAVAVRLTLCLLPAFALHMFVAYRTAGSSAGPDERGVVAGYVVALIVGGALCTDLDPVTGWPIVGLWIAALGFGVYATLPQRYRTAGCRGATPDPVDRLGLTVAAEAVLVVIALRLLTDWPDSPGAVALAITGLVPLVRHRRHVARRSSPASTGCSPTPSRSPG